MDANLYNLKLLIMVVDGYNIEILVYFEQIDITKLV